MNTVKTETPKQKVLSKEELVAARKASLAKEEAFKRHRDELSRLLLADYLDSGIHLNWGT
jgi:predicted dithiol-disulfide oxidoreductase (DUF899 family)